MWLMSPNIGHGFDFGGDPPWVLEPQILVMLFLPKTDPNGITFR